MAYIQVATEASRIVGNTATLLDNIFIHFAEQPRYLGILFDDLSDHLPDYLRFQAQYDCAKQFQDSGGDVIKLNFQKENLFCNFYEMLKKETDFLERVWFLTAYQHKKAI